MSAFASKSFEANEYALHRPSYSIEFFKYVFEYAGLFDKTKENKQQPRIVSILDIGSGPGTCMVTIIPYITDLIRSGKFPSIQKIRLVVTDFSETMIKEAKVNIDQILNHNDKEIFTVEYFVASAEELDKHVENDSIDVVFAAECAHWLEYKSWLSCMNKLLKPKIGVLAYWAYVDPVFTKKIGQSDNISVKKANEFYDSFVYEGDGKLGSYWQQPGRSILRKLYVDLNEFVYEEKSNWDDVITCYRDASNESIKVIERVENEEFQFKINTEALKMEKEIKIRDFVNYIDTWSSSHKWNKIHNDDEKVSELFYNGIKKLTNWELDDVVIIEFKTVYTFCKKKN